MEELKQVLSKGSLDERDLKVIQKNFHLLSNEDLVRLGYKQAPISKTPVKVVEEKEVVKPTKKVTK
jgi:hypothetical protein